MHIFLLKNSIPLSWNQLLEAIRNIWKKKKQRFFALIRFIQIHKDRFMQRIFKYLFEYYTFNSKARKQFKVNHYIWYIMDLNIHNKILAKSYNLKYTLDAVRVKHTFRRLNKNKISGFSTNTHLKRIHEYINWLSSFF